MTELTRALLGLAFSWKPSSKCVMGSEGGPWTSEALRVDNGRVQRHSSSPPANADVEAGAGYSTYRVLYLRVISFTDNQQSVAIPLGHSLDK